ncbi:MAG: hypothetical protein J7K23_01265 [Thermoproteales archaeon]|nr:hypothetical protein [Thermoproteales archaeon]
MIGMKKVYALMIMILLLISLVEYIPAIYAQVSISGKVVNSDLIPLYNVTVEFFDLSKNVLVRRLTTNRQGIFTTSIETGDYKIKIYKRGYEYKEIAQHITQASGGFLGLFILNPAFNINLEAKELIVKQGDNAEIDIVIENKGKFVEEATVNIYAPSNWEANFMTENGLEVKKISLDSSQSKKFKLSIGIGRNSTGIYNVVLSFIYSSIVQNTSITFHVEERDWKFLNTEYPSINCVKGGSLKLKIEVTNTLDETSDINLNVNGPVNWAVRLEDSQGRIVRTVRLNPGDKIDLFLNIRVPENVNVGKYVINLTADSKGAISHLFITVNVIEAHDELRLESSHPYVDSYAGTITEISFTIINEGYGGTEVYFNLSVPNFVKVQILDELGNVLGGIFLDSTSSQKLKLRVIIPEDIKPQPIPITLFAIGRYSTAKIDMGINIIARYNITIKTTNFYKEVTAGERTKFIIEVMNSGTGTINELALIVGKTPPGLTVEVSPQIIKDINIGETVSFTLTIDVDSTVVPGFYLIPFKIIGGGVVKDRLIQVSVKSKSELVYVLLISILVVIVAISAYRKYTKSKK